MPRIKAKTAAMLASPDDIEAQFYEALREGDLNKLMAIWAEDEEVICIHPGGPRLVGAVAVRAGFEAVFSSGPIAVQVDNVRRVQNMSCSVHSVIERIEVPTAEGLQVGWVMATNVFVKTAHGWRMSLHHASPGTAEPPPELVVEAPSVLH